MNKKNSSETIGLVIIHPTGKCQFYFIFYSSSSSSLHGVVTLLGFAGGMESTTGYCPPVWDLLLALA
jgi:hypothetical protein